MGELLGGGWDGIQTGLGGKAKGKTERKEKGRDKKKKKEADWRGLAGKRNLRGMNTIDLSFSSSFFCCCF